MIADAEGVLALSPTNKSRRSAAGRKDAEWRRGREGGQGMYMRSLDIHTEGKIGAVDGFIGIFGYHELLFTARHKHA